MKRNLLYAFTALSFILVGANAMAGDMSNKNVNTKTLNSTIDGNKVKSKPISKVAEVNKMPDDAVVYIQGYIMQNLGNDNYLFQDETGTISIEIDDDIIENNNIGPNTMVFIVASVDKDGNVTSLEAEEIQFLPSNQNQQMKNNANTQQNMSE